MTNKTSEADNKEKAVINCLIAFFGFLIFIAIGSYIYNFRGGSISNSPSDWGVLGDYFGGVVNPLISIITLFFLLRTYQTQKEELRQSGIAAEEQREISQKTAYIQLLSTQISASYELIAIYRGELEGLTLSSTDTPYGRNYTAMNGNTYGSSDEKNSYRYSIIRDVKNEFEAIKNYLSEIKKLSLDSPEQENL